VVKSYVFGRFLRLFGISSGFDRTHQRWLYQKLTACIGAVLRRLATKAGRPCPELMGESPESPHGDHPRPAFAGAFPCKEAG
jgi:hypothetical protein